MNPEGNHPSSGVMIQTEGLSKFFQGKAALENVSLQVPRGSIYGVVGANGAGKSTLLRILLGVMWPNKGTVRLFGQPLPRDSAAFRQRVHYVGADGAVYKSFLVRDFVKYASLTYHRFDESRCQRLLSALELPIQQSIRNLSMGMKMQLRLAVAISARPDILLLDEPTTGLDPVIRKQFLQLIVDEVANDGATVVMATHQLEMVERIADGIAIMYRGRCIADGLLEDFKRDIHCYQVIVRENATGMKSGGIKAEGGYNTTAHLETLTKDPQVIQFEQRGSVWTIVVQDLSGRFLHNLQQICDIVEELPLNLEALFTHLLQREGYSRETILLA